MFTAFFGLLGKCTWRLFLLLSLMCFMAIVNSGCHRSEQKTLPVLRIGHAPHDHHAPLYIAAMNPEHFKNNGGIFLKEISFRKEYILVGDNKQLAQVIIDSSTGGKKLIRTLDEQHNDITFGGVPAMLSFIDTGSEMEILLPVMAEGAGLVMHKELPLKTWDEFVAYANNQDEPVKIGYKIAVSNQNLIFETALKSVSLPFSKNGDESNKNVKVVLINLFGSKNLIPAMQNGIIDGFVVNQPFVAMAEHKGVGKMITSLSDLPPAGKWKNNPCCALAGNKRYVAEHPEVIEQLLSLLLRANQFISQNPEQSATQIAEWLGIDPEIERLSLPTIKYTTDFDEDWHRGVNFWVDSMIESDKLKKNVKTAHEQGTLNKKIYNMQTFNRAQKNN
jgi:NitT/TauT family transport system substrate-binding protein